MPIAASLIVKVAADVGDAQKGLAQADRAVTQFGQSAARSGEAASRGFATLGTAAGVAGGLVATGLVAAGKSAVDFSGRMNEAFTLLPGISGQAMAAMTGQVKTFAADFGVL